jgi:hypothetical protein
MVKAVLLSLVLFFSNVCIAMAGQVTVKLGEPIVFYTMNTYYAPTFRYVRCHGQSISLLFLATNIGVQLLQVDVGDQIFIDGKAYKLESLENCIAGFSSQ